MEKIIENLQNWQKKKKDKSVILDLLKKADHFKINYAVADDASESYHLYAALEYIEKEEYKFIVYMISKNRDTKDTIHKYEKEAVKIIKRFDVVNIAIGEGTEISEDEVKKRKKRWGTEIKEWLDQNEVFDVFDIPKEDFNFNDEKISMQGHFGIKDLIDHQKENGIITGLAPDIMIYQTNSESTTQAFFDMAKLSPPYRNTKHREEFFLLNYKMESLGRN